MEVLKHYLFLSLFICIHNPAVSQSSMSLSNLQFGEQLFPGVTRNITPGDAGSAQFKIIGEAGAEVHVTFLLPMELEDASGNRLPITFGPDSGRYSIKNPVGNSTVFDPNNGFTAPLSLTGELFIWLGGAVNPSPFQPGNFYSVDITIDVSYTTN